jgi:Tol biopolymer transport system component
LLEHSYGVEVAWHPGGQWLVVTERLSPEADPGLCLVSATTGEKRMLIPPPGSPGADLAPAFRPDGKYLAFVRAYYFGSSDLYGVRISDDMTPQGPLVRLTSQPARQTVSPVWTPEGSDILFLAGPFTGGLYLWRIQVENPGAARRIAAAGAGATFLSIPRRFGSKVRLAYAREIRDMNVWRMRVGQSSDRRPTVIAKPALLIDSTREDGNAQFSPDGRRIAFGSSRSGAQELWVSRSDGSNPQRITSFDGVQVGAPHWAPDSERIVFHARPQGRSELFVVKASGGPPRPLSREPILGSVPSWSRDGRWIYFSSNKFELCKVPAEGGRIVQLTAQRGAFGLESFDRKWVYYSKLTESAYSLWKVSPEGDGESQVLESLAGPRSFHLTEEGIYFVPRQAAPNMASMRFLDFATGKVSEVIPLKTSSLGITVFPVFPGQPRTILYDQVDQSGSDLMLVENLVTVQ